MKPPGWDKGTVVRFLWFVLANAALCLFVFRDAMWGRSLLAPLDIAPACFSYYRFVDPEASGVLEGNAQFDQVVYDLPLQHGIYQALRRGEMPWWDPYGYSGRPLLADAHINGTDPIRLLAYALLPFELAYNWTLIGHFFACGLTMFCLLQSWRMRPWICTLLALTFAFAGSQTFFFGFPWLHGSMVYYPLVWLAWDAAVRTGRRGWWAVASLAIGAIFYSGNLQSHAYLVVFGAAFGVGYAGVSWARWRRVFPMLLCCGVFGACLAAPVLLNQLEFFLAGVRPVKAAVSARVYLAGLACLTSVYPWMLGDFRTLDARSAFFQSIGFGQNYGLGFHTFIGSAGLILALLGATRRCPVGYLESPRRTGLALGIGFLVIVSSPLISVFYTRCAGLFVLGAMVLAAAGLQILAEGVRRFRFWGWATAVLAVGMALATNWGALILYPRVLPKVRELMEARDQASVPGAVFKMPQSYRAFQVENLPNEVSFRNPETVLAFAGLLWMAGVLLGPRLRSRNWAVSLLLLLNILPVVLFASRFIPRQPIQLWDRLRAGGPDQQNAIDTLQPGRLRLLETAAARNDFLFPDAMEHLYGIHTVHGYSALIPKSIQSLVAANAAREPDIKVADFVFQDGRLRKEPGQGLARFQWLTPSERQVQVEQSSLNEIRLSFGPGPEAPLLWTDTRYPGWTATRDGKPLPLEPQSPSFTRLQIPPGPGSVLLRYRPRFLPLGLVLAFAGATGVAVLSSSRARLNDVRDRFGAGASPWHGQSP